MRPSVTLPAALTIAGSDSGGGAGIQADLKTFFSLGLHGTSAITCITAQNPEGVTGIQACSPKIVRDQIEAVCTAFHPRAAKTGMLYSASIIRMVTDCLKRRSVEFIVVDPVMVATSGARLLKPDALRALTRKLFSLATLITPNLDEAELLTGLSLRSPEDLRTAAKCLHEHHGCAVLVKGGHLRGLTAAIDIFYDGRNELLLAAPFVRHVSTHGTGCTYSAAITAFLALGRPLPAAVQSAKNYISQAIAGTVNVARHHVLDFRQDRLRNQARPAMR